jgi:hypothetical protein
MRVRANTTYRYDPTLLDVVGGRTSLKTGDLVRVVNLPGCPRANTMGHCHVADPLSNQFIGLVCCNSLKPTSPDDLKLIETLLRVARVSRRDMGKK